MMGFPEEDVRKALRKALKYQDIIKKFYKKTWQKKHLDSVSQVLGVASVVDETFVEAVALFQLRTYIMNTTHHDVSKALEVLKNGRLKRKVDGKCGSLTLNRLGASNGGVPPLMSLPNMKAIQLKDDVSAATAHNQRIGKLLAVDSSSPNFVAQVEAILNMPRAQRSGVFTDHTTRHLARFQHALGLGTARTDGIKARLGRTDGALDGWTILALEEIGKWLYLNNNFNLPVPTRPVAPPPGASAEQLYQHFMAIARLAIVDWGLDLDTSLEEQMVLSLRGVRLENAASTKPKFRAHTHESKVTREYDDTMVRLRVFPNQHQVKFFKCVTHSAWISNSAGIPDLDRDGHKDTAMIRAGLYRAKYNGKYPRKPGGLDSYHVQRITKPEGSNCKIGDLNAYRNVNREMNPNKPQNKTWHLGNRWVFSERMMAMRRRSGSQVYKEVGETANAILIHVGGARAGSIGCQTMSKKNMKALSQNPKKKLWRGPFLYIVIDARDFILAHPDFGMQPASKASSMPVSS